MELLPASIQCTIHVVGLPSLLALGARPTGPETKKRMTGMQKSFNHQVSKVFPNFRKFFFCFPIHPPCSLVHFPPLRGFPKKYPPAKATWGRQKKVTVQLRNDAGEKGSLT
jgi:hypothetical protein